MSSLLEPKVLRSSQNIQLSSDTSQRIHSTTCYPVLSPNGSTIIIYGSDNGVRLVWRGGRAFKATRPPKGTDTTKPNGGQSDAVMIIDSDDEGASQEPEHNDTPEFEDKEDEVDASKPYPPVLQYLDLALGTAVLHISVPPATVSDPPSGSSPGITEDKIVFAAACADNLVRIITLPLTPPSPASKSREALRKSSTTGYAGNGKWDETIVALSGHQMVVDAVSITLVSSKLQGADTAITERSRSQSRSRGDNDDWQILVASHSRAVSGLLLLHRVQIESSTKGGKSLHSLKKSRSLNLPFQTQYLSSPAVTISFNTSVFTSRATQLLLADKSGACKIYDCQPLSFDSEDTTSFATQGGAWLLTLLPGFQSSKSDGSNAAINAAPFSNYGRKSIVDVKWVLGGKAIIALLADGGWGVWDVEGAQPGSSKGLLGRTSMKGGAITRFSISGWIDGAPVKSASRNTTQQITGKFAPMTPGTRRTVEPILFSGRTGHGTAHGSISVARLPAPSTTSAADESVAIWLEESFVIIPNLLGYWEAQRSKTGGQGNLFNSGKSGSRLIRIDNVNLQGEKCCGIDQIVRSQSSTKSGLPAELVIVGEHRFVILSDVTVDQLDFRKVSVMSTANESQALVPRLGDLDVTGIEEQLERMDQRSYSRGRKGVGFLA